MSKTKFSLIALSLLICAVAFGAVPSFDSFDPTYFQSNHFKITLRTNNLPSGGGQSNAIANLNGLGTNATLKGNTIAEKVVATNFTGNAIGATNLQASVLTGVSTNIAVSNIAASIITTNQVWDASLIAFSNSITTAAANGPALIPIGGEYNNLRITNSPTLTATIEQVCIGYPLAQKFDTSKRTTIIRNGIFWSDGLAGDAASFKTAVVADGSGISTNDYYFYNDWFHAANFCFNQVGYGNYHFYNCLFDGTYGFTPDQGPETNFLIGCEWNTPAGMQDGINGGKLAISILAQIASRTHVVGGHITLSTTNSSAESTAVAFSGEGNTITIFDGTHILLRGNGTNSVLDARVLDSGSGQGTGNIVYFNNVIWEGTNAGSATPIVVYNLDNEGASTTIIVNGGNLIPANFASLNGVTFLSSQLTGTNTWSGSTNNFSGDVGINGKLSAGSTFTASAAANFGGVITGNGSGLTNFTFVQTTNSNNTGVGSVGSMMLSNLTGNVTLGGFTGLQNDKANTVIWGFSASGADRTISDMVNCLSTDGTRSFVCTNGQWCFATYLIVQGRLTNRVSVVAGR